MAFPNAACREPPRVRWLQERRPHRRLGSRLERISDYMFPGSSIEVRERLRLIRRKSRFGRILAPERILRGRRSGFPILFPQMVESPRASFSASRELTCSAAAPTMVRSQRIRKSQSPSRHSGVDGGVIGMSFKTKLNLALFVLTLSATTFSLSGAQAGKTQTQTARPVAALSGVPVFEADPKWPVLPADWTWGQVIGIFADSQGHVWTSSRSRISEWDPQGKLLQSWDARGPNGNWSTIHGMFVDHNGYVWTNARESNLTVKFTRTGQVAMVIGKYNQTGGSNDTTLMGRPSGSITPTTECSSPTATGIGASSCSTEERGAICGTGARTASRQSIRHALRVPRRAVKAARLDKVVKDRVREGGPIKPSRRR